MHATSESLKLDTDSPDSLALEVPLVQFYLNPLLAFAPWPAALWVFWQGQFSRYSAFLTGGAPI
ncbi:MAG: hypothetical protein JSS14_14750 [Proteobacteria bacterium]|nr:hypothetical protein [Pseudomonadota bacterium]